MTLVHALLRLISGGADRQHQRIKLFWLSHCGRKFYLFIYLFCDRRSFGRQPSTASGLIFLGFRAAVM